MKTDGMVASSFVFRVAFVEGEGSEIGLFRVLGAISLV